MNITNSNTNSNTNIYNYILNARCTVPNIASYLSVTVKSGVVGISYTVYLFESYTE